MILGRGMSKKDVWVKEECSSAVRIGCGVLGVECWALSVGRGVLGVECWA